VGQREQIESAPADARPPGRSARPWLWALLAAAILVLGGVASLTRPTPPGPPIDVAAATPSPTLTSTATPSPTPTLTATPSPTPTPEPTDTPAASAGTPPAPTLPPLPSADEEVEAALIEAINRLRADRGCDVALRPSAQLTAAARRHSDDMATHNFFDHRGSDGGDRISRAVAAGYVGVPGTRVRENLAAATTDSQVIIDFWLTDADPWHASQMLDCAYNDIGVGYRRAEGTRYTDYITTMFGVGP
jgi:uncharacterized protein YkwD